MQIKVGVISIKYKIIAICCFIILSVVQFFFLFNSYQLKEKEYFNSERDTVNKTYTSAIASDKLYPGGERIIDTYITDHLGELEYLFYNSKKRFYLYSDSICDAMFFQLQKKSNIDSLLHEIISKEKIIHNYTYALIVKGIDLSFKSKQFIPIYPYQKKDNYALISGNSSSIKNENLITALYVSDDRVPSYRISFALYIQNNERTKAIIMSMLPIYIMSLLSIGFIITLFTITFNNWIRQKKLAEMQSDFINSITHEFNTPLTAIMIANKSLQNDKLVSQNSTISSLTSIIARQSLRLNQLFKQVLNITVANEALLKKRYVNISEITTQIITDYKLKINKKDTLTFHNYLNNEFIQLDKFWYTTMVQNLIDNGFKYNFNSHKSVEVSLKIGKNGIVLAVKDNGIGMSGPTVKKIFDKFYRFNNDSSIGGLGLGLFYVKQCIKMHKWNIEISSKEDQGSTFSVVMS